MPTYHAEQHSAASSSTIWALLIDPHSWPTWTPIDQLVTERSEGLDSEDRRSRVGTIQTFRTGDVVTSERITELVLERRFCYQDASNEFMYNYEAVVELLPDKNGTTIIWRGTYDTYANFEQVLPDYLSGFMQQHVDGLASKAEEIERIGALIASVDPMRKSVIDRLLTAVNARDPDAVAECFVDDYECEWPAHPDLSFTGKENVRRNQVMRFEAWPTVQAEIVHSIWVDDEVWQDWRFYGNPPTDQEQRGVIALVIDRERDLIRSSRFYVETMEGVRPP